MIDNNKYSKVNKKIHFDFNQITKLTKSIRLDAEQSKSQKKNIQKVKKTLPNRILEIIIIIIIDQITKRLMIKTVF